MGVCVRFGWILIECLVSAELGIDKICIKRFNTIACGTRINQIVCINGRFFAIRHYRINPKNKYIV